MPQAAVKTQHEKKEAASKAMVEAAKNKAADEAKKKAEELEAKKAEEEAKNKAEQEAKKKREQEVWPHSGIYECASLGSVGGGCILRRPLVRADWAHPFRHVCTRNWRLLPNRHPEWAHPCNICAAAGTDRPDLH